MDALLKNMDNQLANLWYTVTVNALVVTHGLLMLFLSLNIAPAAMIVNNIGCISIVNCLRFFYPS